MEHKEYRKIIPEADTAVLFIHGIVGTPNHFQDLIPLVQEVPADWSVCNVLLPGHGSTVEAFGRSSMKEWKKHVQYAFESLARTHEQVIVVAHSMGTLFALQLAGEHPDKILFLFLLAVPLRPGMRLSGIKNMLRLAFGKIRENQPLEKATQLACGIEVSPCIWKYITWIPRYLELFREICHTEKLFPFLAVPAEAWQSAKDELVRPSAVKVLKKAGTILIHVLPDSTHFYYGSQDRSAVLESFRQKCNAYRKKQD